MTETFISVYFDCFVWSMSHLLTWSGKGLWAILQATTRGASHRPTLYNFISPRKYTKKWKSLSISLGSQGNLPSHNQDANKSYIHEVLLMMLTALCVSVSWCLCCWIWSSWSSVGARGFDPPSVSWRYDHPPATCWLPRPAPPVCPASCWTRRRRRRRRKRRWRKTIMMKAGMNCQRHSDVWPGLHRSLL